MQLAERLGAPVLTTPKCKGAIPEDHALRAGCIIGGLIERNLVNASDLIITVGLDAVELQPKPWPYTLPVLALSGTPSLDALVPAEPEVVGDLKTILAGLAEWATAGSNWGEKAAKTFRDDVNKALDTPSTGPLAAAGDGDLARRAAARHHRHLRCRSEPPARRAEMAVLRSARVPGLQRPGLHGLRGARRAWARGWRIPTGPSSPSSATAAS